MVMELGDNPLKSEEAAKGAAPCELPFINVQRYLARAGAAVPAIHRYDAERGFVYLEDLGDITFESRVADAGDDVRARYYRQAIDQLVALQRFAAAHPDPECVAFSRGFDYELLKWELDHFREYGLEAQGLELSPAERDEVEQASSVASPRSSPPSRAGFVHRDYQSRNLMVQDLEGAPRLRIIDFQDALLGTRAYDLVGLLRDSYVALSPSLLDDLVAHFVDERPLDAARFQRALRSAGRAAQVEGRGAFRLHRSRQAKPVVPGAHSQQPRLRRALAGAASGARLAARNSFTTSSTIRVMLLTRRFTVMQVIDITKDSLRTLP